MKGCRPLNYDEKKRLINITSSKCKRDKLLILLGLSTGFRISELLSLKIRDLIAPNGQVLNGFIIK